MMYMCSCCGGEFKQSELVPHPQDEKQEVKVCVACDYAIQASLTAISDQFDEEFKDYGSVTHGA